MNTEQVTGFVRHILTFGGGYLVAKGVIDEATMLNLVGAGATIIGLIWSILSKKKPAV